VFLAIGIAKDSANAFTGAEVEVRRLARAAATPLAAAATDGGAA
jgi:hypothetical protein